MAIRIALALMCVLALPAAAGVASARVAVFPFEMSIDLPPDALPTMPPKPKPDEVKRLALVTAELQALLGKSGRYVPVDLSAEKDKIEDKSPFHKCNGCEADLAKAVGADIAVTGLIHKVSESLLSITVMLRGAESGDVMGAMNVSIMEYNDEGWLRGVRWLVRNRLLAEAQR